MTDRPRRLEHGRNRRNHYRTLHVQPDAPLEVIKANYRTLMQTLRLHPDLGGDHQAAVQVNEAYAVLGDPGRRAAYDRELFARYDVATVSRGPLPGGQRRGEPTPGPAAGNKRNYYRLLQVQPDAPVEVIESSYRALSAASSNARLPLAEALATLRDPEQRSAYDRSLERRRTEHAPGTSLDRRSDRTSVPAYEPLATPSCAFCGAGHRATRSVLEQLGCVRCGSPLFPPDEGLADEVRRLNRSPQQGPIGIFTSWPGTRIGGALHDLSPAGLRLTTTSTLAVGDLVKIEGTRLQAVGTVVHCQREAGVTSAGVRFRTVGFGAARGSFFSARA